MGDTDKKDFSYIINNLYFLALVGLIIKLFLTSDTTSDGSSGPASASIWGYSLMACSVLGMLIVTYALNNNANMGNWKEGNLKFVKNIFTNSILPVLMLGILAWLITLNGTYFKEINEGKVASEYSLYNNLSTFLIICFNVVYLSVVFTVSRGARYVKAAVSYRYYPAMPTLPH